MCSHPSASSRVCLFCRMAPEVLVGKYGEAHYGPKVDVYSFGIVLFEIATGQLPYPEHQTLLDLERAVASGERPKLPTDTDAPDAVVKLMERCWAADAQNRPDFREIALVLSQIHIGQSSVTNVLTRTQ